VILLRILFLSLFICGTSLADDSSKMLSYPQNKIMGFLGLDTKSKPPLLQDGRAIDLQNVILDSSFNLRKRYGYSVINTTLDDYSESSPAITGIFDAHYSDATRLFVFGGDYLKYDNSGTWSEITGTVAFTSSQYNQWKCTMAYDKAICTNNTDTPISIASTPSYSNLTWTGLTHAVTKFKDSLFFQNYLILVNTVENSVSRLTRFRWSDVGNISSWDNDNYLDIATLGGDAIYSIKELGGNIYVLLSDSIYIFSLVGGNDVFKSSKVIEGFGTVSRDSVQNVKINDTLGLIFLGANKHIYFFNGSVVSDIGDRIQPTLDTLNESRLGNAVSFYDDKQYCLSAASSGETENDVIYCYQTEIGEWYKLTAINANVFAKVETSSLIKTYFGNYKSFVYWFNDPDQINDVDGAAGIIDSVSTATTTTETGASILIDTTLPIGVYTGATVKITSGTGQNQEAVILSQADTYLVLTTALSTTPDSTSTYSIGSIDSYYETKWYDFGMSQRNKLFRWLFLWAEEQTSNEFDISYKIDFGSTLGSETIDLAPVSSSLWDTAIWDESVWGTTGDSFDIIDLNGRGRFMNFKISNDDIDETFNIYGFHLISDALDVK
jgi:hypothetical protein